MNTDSNTTADNVFAHTDSTKTVAGRSTVFSESPTGAGVGLMVEVAGLPQLVNTVDMPVTIGRSSQNRITVLDPSVSNHHATLTHDAGEWRYVDHSTFGTFVAGERIEELPITDGVAFLLADPHDGPSVIVTPCVDDSSRTAHANQAIDPIAVGATAKRAATRFASLAATTVLASAIGIFGVVSAIDETDSSTAEAGQELEGVGVPDESDLPDINDATPELPGDVIEEPGDTPDDDTNTPDDDTNTPDDDTNKPDDDTNKPDDDTNKPDDDTNKPDDDTNTPDDDTNTPDDDTNTPDDDTNTPDDDTNTPDDDTNKPDDDTNTPDDDTNTPGELYEDLDTAVLVVDDFWAKHWSDYFTGEYVSPNVVGLYDGTSPDAPTCNGVPLDANNAFYCYQNDSVQWDVGLMADGYGIGDSFVYLVIAHEWGHAIQARLDNSLIWNASELQADCLAGAALFGAAAEGTLLFEQGDTAEIAMGLAALGDDTPWTDSSTHGDSFERVDAFDAGRRGGVTACLPTSK